jgi:serine/threonine protein kinase
MTAPVLHAGDRMHGERGGEYRVLEWRAEGSYARVYRAENSRPAPRVPIPSSCAIKLAKAEIPGAAARLERERTVHERVRHPGLPELWDFGRWEGIPFLVLSWIDGSDLRQLVERQRRLPLTTALRYLQDIAAAVAALHAGGFAHGDLRPQNIVVEAAGPPRLPDRTLDGPLRGVGRRGRLSAGEAGGRERRPRAVLVDLGEAAGSDGAGAHRHPDADLRALGDLLAFMLTGSSGEAAHSLTSANGYNPGVIRLWEETRAGRLTTAALQKKIAVLIQAIGATR